MSKLPSGWTRAALEEVATVIMGQSPDSSTYNEDGQGLPFFQGKAEFGKLYPIERKWCSVPGKVAEPGDILLSIRAPVGPTNLAPKKCCIGRGLCAIRAQKNLDQKFLLYYLRSIEGWLSQQGTGSTFQAISGGFVRTICVPVAPLEEQKRLVHKLEVLIASVDCCRERLNKVSILLKRFRQAVLAAAGSSNDDLCPSTPLGDCIERLKTGPFGSALHKSDYVSNGIPIVNPMHIIDGSIIPTADMTVTHETMKRLRDYALSEGDVVIARRGVMGRCAVVKKNAAGWLCGTGSMIVTPSKQILPEYLQMFLSSPATVAVLEADSVGSTMVNLNQKIFLGLKLKLPSVSEQQDIIRRVQSQFALADNIETSLENSIIQMDRLMPALLTKGYRGELVANSSVGKMKSNGEQKRQEPVVRT